MKYILFLLGITYIISAIYIAKFFYFDEQNKDIYEKYKEKIVIIIPEKNLESMQSNPSGIFDENTKSGIGAGFFINESGKIKTVNHIVENQNIEYKVIHNGNEYKTEVISRDKKNDLAILQIINPIKEFNYFDIETNNNFGQQITSFGVDIENMKIVYNTGTIINKKSKLDDKSNLLEISNILQNGFSGGPIINSNGKVIGINYAISAGKNYGIKINTD